MYQILGNVLEEKTMLLETMLMCVLSINVCFVFVQMTEEWNGDQNWVLYANGLDAVSGTLKSMSRKLESNCDDKVVCIFHPIPYVPFAIQETMIHTLLSIKDSSKCITTLFV